MWITMRWHGSVPDAGADTCKYFHRERRHWSFRHINLPVTLVSGGYKQRGDGLLATGTGGNRQLLQDRVFHLRDRTDDWIIGHSRLQRAAAVVQAGLSIQQLANFLRENGVNSSSSLKVAGRLTEYQYHGLAARLRAAYSGSHHASKAIVLDQAIQWGQISINPEDAKFLASGRFTVEELARIFNVPAPIIRDLQYGTFSNVETLLRWFARNSISPWIRRVEAEFSRSVLGAASRGTHRLEIDLSGLMRRDPAQRWGAWKIAVEAGRLTPDEVRAEEGWKPRSAQTAL